VLDAIVLRGMARDPAARWASAREMALALEAAITPAQPSRVGAFVEAAVGGDLEARASRVAEAESTSNSSEMHALLDDLARSGAPASTAVAAKSSPRELVTSPGTASDTPAAPRRRRPALWVVAAAALVGVGFASRGLVSREVTTPAPTPSAAPAVAVPAASVAAAPEAKPSIAPPPSALPSASASPAPSPSATIRPVPAPAPRPTSKPKADCNPPWTLDSSGRKKYKLECL
jgi:serine/threonine-protein kinase